MSISFKYPITKADGSEFKSAKELLDQLNGEATGFYLLSAHGFWHGGLHISDKTTAYAADKHPVRCMADGEVVAYRLNHDYVTSTWGDDPTVATLEYSTSFCLVRHRYESPHKRPAPAATTETTAAAPAAPASASAAPASGAASPANAQATAAQPASAPPAAAATADQGPQNKLVFYSLYMHLLPYSGYLPSVGPTTTAATRNAPPYWESSHKITGTLKAGCNARNDPANGHIGNPIHVLPADSTVEIQQEQQLKLGSKKQAFVQVKILTLGTGNAGTLSVGQLAWISGQSKFLARDLIQPDVFDSVVVCEQPHPISAGDPIGYLGLYETPSAGANGKTSRKQVHIELFTGDPQFDDFYANKAGLTDGKKLKVAGTDVAPAAMSSTTFTPGSDRLILSVVVDVTPALAKPDAQHKNWFPVQGIGDNGVLSGYVAESQLKDVVQYDWEKLGFRKVEETNDNADGYMDPEKVPAFFKKIYSLIDRNTDNDITPDELLAANQNPVVRDALAHVIAKHPSEWQGASGAAKWNVLKDKDALLRNDPKRLKHEQDRIDKLTWWNDVTGVANFPSSPNVWHLNPAAFLEAIMQDSCTCTEPLTKPQIKQIATHASNTVIDKYLSSLNQAFDDYNFTKCIARAHFLAQMLHESGEFHYTKELGSNLPYDPWRGRGLMQLTGELNYTAYENYAGEDVTSNQAAMEKLEVAPHAMLSAAWFFSIKSNLQTSSINDDFNWITRVVNGGFNGYNERLQYLNAAIKVLGITSCAKLNINGSYAFETSKVYTEKHGAFAWGLWHDPGLNKSGMTKVKDEALKGYQRYIALDDAAGQPTDAHGLPLDKKWYGIGASTHVRTYSEQRIQALNASNP